MDCINRPDLLPREPSLTQSERSDLEAVLPAYRAYLKPGAPNEISYLLTCLRAIYFVPDLPNGFANALADDWADDLAPYPLWAVDLACKRYRRREPDHTPRPGHIVALADEETAIERQLLQEIDMALAVPPGDEGEAKSGPPACAVWCDHYADLCADFGFDVFNAWLKCCIPESDVDGVLTLAVPTDFIGAHIDKNYKEGLQKTLGRIVQFVTRAYSSNANWAKEYKARLEKSAADEDARKRGVHAQ